MKSLKPGLEFVGGIMLFFGVFSSLLYFIGYEVKILMWIETWGDLIGWYIRGGLVLVGGLMWFLGDGHKTLLEKYKK